ncbi:hypothetical protein CEXT_270561 [Caerostris extrusa]|uniref:Uncharacterized protein n=1 Tax=Caerostris extrusa TaxID=172846 RepID=A0AAV4SGE2_CAEEX|nr:hypothetical protein CEXT_270561 [Caerostris extrusa]
MSKQSISFQRSCPEKIFFYDFDPLVPFSGSGIVAGRAKMLQAASNAIMFAFCARKLFILFFKFNQFISGIKNLAKHQLLRAPEVLFSSKDMKINRFNHLFKNVVFMY